MNIDWSKAPDWAVAHGLHETGFGIKEFWLSETQHQNLEHAKSFPYGGGDASCGSFHNSRCESFSYVTERPVAWNGKGLPPRGTKCEVQPWKEHEAPWIEVEFIASWLAPNGQTYSWVHTGYGWKEPQMFRFRPIRTPEQIAADKRLHEIRNALTAIKAGEQQFPSDFVRGNIVAATVEAMIDAGYRKQVSE